MRQGRDEEEAAHRLSQGGMAEQKHAICVALIRTRSLMFINSNHMRGTAERKQMCVHTRSINLDGGALGARRPRAAAPGRTSLAHCCCILQHDNEREDRKEGARAVRRADYPVTLAIELSDAHGSDFHINSSTC